MVRSEIDLGKLIEMAEKEGQFDRMKGELSSALQWEVIESAARALLRLQTRKEEKDHGPAL